MSRATVVHTTLGGPLGAALEANRTGRLSRFIDGAHSPAITLFGAAHRAQNHEGDWYGEHAGKWLYAAAKAYRRSNDATLRENLRNVADYLLAQQEPDGYLGTYAPERRFMQPQPPKPPSWDGAPSVRTWDIWVHAYLVLGLIEAQRALGDKRYLAAAQRIADLCQRTLDEGRIDICDLGNHHGMSATVLLDAAMELYAETREPRHLVLAETVLAQADANPSLNLLGKALAGTDAAEIATGKAYQLLWTLVGVAKLYRATGRDELRAAIESLWRSVRDHHVSEGGGPWGGVAHRSREVFNAPGSFSPQGYVETCSTLAWLQLNRELLQINDDPRHADEIERSAYNDLLGAQAPDGEDWCYYVFPNGRRVHTTYWRCCKSSGAMALEELPALACRSGEDGSVTLDIYGPSHSRIEFADGAWLALAQETDYPFDGAIALRLNLSQPRRFVLRLRIPAWAHGAQVRINGDGAIDAASGRYLQLERDWRDGDTVALELPMPPRLVRRANRNVQESRAPDGSLVRQTVLDDAYVAIVRGPLVYATGLIDGYKTQETVRLSDDDAQALRVERRAGRAPLIHVAPAGREPLAFEPYYLAGGRVDGAWRLTWLSLAPA